MYIHNARKWVIAWFRPLRVFFRDMRFFEVELYCGKVAYEWSLMHVDFQWRNAQVK